MNYEAYEVGYKDGENSRNFDWMLALSDAFDWCDGLEGPNDFIERLQSRLPTAPQTAIPSARPWKLDADIMGDFTISRKGEKLVIAVIIQNGFRSHEETAANAELIVNAVNSFGILPSVEDVARAAALNIANDLIGICEAATKVAQRTGNTFVIDRQRTASMIAGRILSLFTTPTTTNISLTQLRKETIEECARIAEPWAGFWPLDDATKTDLAIIKVRKEIAEHIRSIIGGGNK